MKSSIAMKFWNFQGAIILLFMLSVFMIAKGFFVIPLQKEGDVNDAEIVLEKFTTNPELKLFNSEELNERKWKNLSRMDYSTIKKMIGVEEDFCMYLEDARGNLVRVDGSTVGIGSNRILINGRPC